VEDEGAGPPPDFDPTISRGLGMRLLGALLRGGGLALERQAALTRFIATLPALSNGANGAR
jgi:two-component sensor histidine kinase